MVEKRCGLMDEYAGKEFKMKIMRILEEHSLMYKCPRRGMCNPSQNDKQQVLLLRSVTQ
jgi:hypothetical protein